MLADDWGKPISTFQKYIDALEEELIETGKDLILIVERKEDWKEISSTWPKATRARIEDKLQELKKGK